MSDFTPSATANSGPAQPPEAMAETSPAVTEAASHRQRTRQVVEQLTRRFRGPAASTGDLAELRRLDPRRGHVNSGGAFWRIVTGDLEPDGLLDGYADDDRLRRWMAILQGLAVVYDLHGPPLRLGQAMAAADISEARLIRLLRGTGTALLAQIRPLAHQLKSAAQPVRWADAADLVLSDGAPHADSVRQHIASDFYRRQYRESKSSDQ